MPRPPKTITVMGSTWLITTGAKAYAAAVADQAEPGPGITDPLTQCVALAPDLPLDAERRILAHELVHVALNMSGWLEEIVTADGHEEAVCCALERPLVSLVADNPELIAYLGG